MNLSSLILLPLIVAISFGTSASTELDIGYDSKYVSEGRNNLPTGGIVWISVNQEVNDALSLSIAYGDAKSSKVDYEELNVTIEYNQQVGDLLYAFSYTRLEFLADNEGDNELGLSGSWSGYEQFTPTFELVYSTEAKGAFLELGIESEYALNNFFVLSPYARVAFDFGYARDKFEGHNHSSLGAILTYQINDTFSINTIAEYNLGGSLMKKILGEESDQAWAGLHLTASF